MWHVARSCAGRRLSHMAPRRALSSSVLAVREEVRQALHDGAPVVALESTIISHGVCPRLAAAPPRTLRIMLTLPHDGEGMPYPQNLATARQVEDVVRSEGAVPATVALLGGKVGAAAGLMLEVSLALTPAAKVHVGLGEAELALLAETGPQAVKCSRCAAAPSSPAYTAGTAPSSVADGRGSAGETFLFSSPAGESARPLWQAPCAYPRSEGAVLQLTWRNAVSAAPRCTGRGPAGWRRMPQAFRSL